MADGKLIQSSLIDFYRAPPAAAAQSCLENAFPRETERSENLAHARQLQTEPSDGGIPLSPHPANEAERCEHLTQEQQQVVDSSDGFVVIEAGPGTGKTRTVTARMKHLIDSLDVLPEQVLALTFSRKAKDEMADRLGQSQLAARVHTFHSFCRLLLLEEGWAIGVPSDFKTLTEPASVSIVRALISGNAGHAGGDDGSDDESAGGTSCNANPQEVYKAILAAKRARALSSYRDGDGASASTHAPADSALEHYCEKYRAILEQMTPPALDFEDLLLKAYELLKLEWARERHASRYRYVLIDEFQDTCAIQCAIAAALASFHNNLMVVGDRNQCIYTWRNAERGNCAHAVLAAPLFLDHDSPLPPDPHGGSPLKLWTANADGARVQYHMYNDEADEVDGIASHLRQLLEQCQPEGNSLDDLRVSLHGLKASEIAVLTRTTRQLYAVEQALKRMGVPCRRQSESSGLSEGASKSTTAKDARTVRSLCALLQLPLDAGDMGLIQSESDSTEVFLDACRLFGGLGEKTGRAYLSAAAALRLPLLRLVTQSARGNTPPPLKPPAGRQAEGLRRMARVHEEMAAAMGCGAARIAPAVRVAVDALRELQPPSDHASARGGLRGRASARLDARRHGKLQESGAAQTAGGKKPAAAVWLSTIHRAKGLEWRVVWIPGVEDGNFPLSTSLRLAGLGGKAEERCTLHVPLFLRARRSASNAKAQAELLREEQRLLYVAVTRARQALIFSRAITRNGSASAPSPFVRALPVSSCVPLALLSDEISLAVDPYSFTLSMSNPQHDDDELERRSRPRSNNPSRASASHACGTTHGTRPPCAGFRSAGQLFAEAVNAATVAAASATQIECFEADGA
ncbi:hypothetical protein AB1Y20_018194 [Prymnesium parvum]|uniref:DNA 3'-5' helicase n=1 Tax=Prymnesium parvum TaxID=97485 RepID=A0AB34JQ80_PRYPA